MDVYLNDPSISAGILKSMLDECPLAAWHRSWLNPNRKPETSDAMSLGTVIHAALLENNFDVAEVVDPKDYPGVRGGIPRGWTTDLIKAKRDSIIAAGKIPL